MKNVMIALFLLVAMLQANSVEMLDLSKKGSDWKAEVLIDPPVIVDKTVVSDTNSSSEVDFKTDLPTSMFFLIDTSIPMKQAYKQGVEPLLLEMDRVKDPREQWAVAYFDTDMHIVYDDSKQQQDELEKALKSIPVKGQRTELWRNTQDAIKALSKMPGERKILILLSDGEAEDTSAYTREDVIEIAKKAHIRIVSLSYRDTMGTQNLRKISEETHGVFWKADKATHKLPSDFHRELVEFIRSQGIVTIPSSLLHPTKTGKQDLNITFEHASGKSMFALTVETAKIVPPKPKVKPQPKVQPKAKVPVQTKSKMQLFLEKYKIYLIAVGILLLLVILFLLFRKKEEPVVEEEPTIANPVPSEENEQTKVVSVEEEPLAYFESFDGKRHNVYGIPASIGKSRDNDVAIPGEYISRNHALLVHKNGYFYLSDKNSSNGVFVDGRKIHSETKIENGSRIGFGPYETVFRVVAGNAAPAIPVSDDSEKTRLNR